MKKVSPSLASSVKSCTFALAKREGLLTIMGVTFLALRRKSSLTDFHRQKL